MNINAVSACWSAYTYEEALQKIHQGTYEPLLGALSHEHVQLCPQHKNIITPELIDSLKTLYPETQFRLHADVRILGKIGYTIDLMDYSEKTAWYFEKLGEYSRQLNAPCYSLHVGERKHFTLQDMIDKAHKVQEYFDCPIALEGHYPLRKKYLIDSWDEYTALYHSGLSYALDLSHLHIVATHEKGWDVALVETMLQSPQCLEVHISFNDGKRDSHQLALAEEQALWTMWQAWLAQKHENAIVFSEGNQTLFERQNAKKVA